MSWDIGKITAGLQQWGEQVREAAADAIAEVAEQWLEEGNRMVPIEEGTLQNSGTTEVDRSNLQAAVGWGAGGSSDYAVIQHENTSFQHDAGRSAKWGEIAGRKIAATAGQDIATAIKARVG